VLITSDDSKVKTKQNENLFIFQNGSSFTFQSNPSASMLEGEVRFSICFFKSCKHSFTWTMEALSGNDTTKVNSISTAFLSRVVFPLSVD